MRIIHVGFQPNQWKLRGHIISSNLEGNILMPPDQFGIDINDQTSTYIW